MLLLINKENSYKNPKKRTKITSLPLIPVELVRLYNSEQDKADNKYQLYVRVRYRTSDNTEAEALVLMNALANPLQHQKELQAITAQGYCFTKSAQNRFGELFLDVVKHATAKKLLPVKVGYGKTGWAFDEKNEPVYVKVGDSKCIGNYRALTDKAGSPEVWKEAIRDTLQISPMTGLLMASAMSGYMRGLIVNPEFCLLVHLSGAGARGKSLASKITASIQSYPNKKEGKPSVFFDSATTRPAFESLLASANNGFLCPDEIHGFFATAGQNVVETMMMLLNNGGKLKFDAKNFDNLSVGKYWNLVVITTGNTSIVNHEAVIKHPQAHALSQRVLEIDVNQNPVWLVRDIEKVDSITKRLEENYGHGIEPALEYIKANQDKIKERFIQYSNDNINALSADSEQERRASIFAFMRCGIEILDAVVSIPEDAKDNIYKLYNKFWNETLNFAQTVEDKQEDALTTLISLVNSNLHSAKIDGYLYTKHDYGLISEEEAQAKKAREVSDDATRRRVLIRVEQKQMMNHETDYTGIIKVAKTIESDLRIQSEYKLTDIVESARKGGWLIVSKGRYYDLKDKMLGHCYCFDINKAITLLEQTRELRKSNNSNVVPMFMREDQQWAAV
jgi:hypothetical protein